MSFNGQMSEDSKAWVKHISWSCAAAVCAAVGTKLGEWAIEEIRSARKAKKADTKTGTP